MKRRRKSTKITDVCGSALIFVLFCVRNVFHVYALPALPTSPTQTSISIANVSRFNDGDTFISEGGECGMDTCVGLSSGTAAARAGTLCTCQCLPHLPAFREDLNICVDDIRECPVAPFVSGSLSQQIPFVFLPLKGQIVHPSKEISFVGIQTPICAVSGAQFLTRGGWVELRSTLDADVPFSLFRDEGRTFLQWLGEPELRLRMSGRLILVHMMCRDIGNTVSTNLLPLQNVFTPCVAFRVVGTPVRHQNNVSEVLFAPDAHSAEKSSGLTSTEYITIAICSVLLGLIYVASVFLYLHIRRRRQKQPAPIDIIEVKEPPQNVHLAGNGTEIIVKNNPLLNLGRHFPSADDGFVNDNSSCQSENDVIPDVLKHREDQMLNRKTQVSQIQVTSALVHPSHDRFSLSDFNCIPESYQHQESPNMERLPEENVSIVETIEGREDRGPDSVRAIMSGSTRRKLYFNPAYFEPHLLLAPPPAAIEFLTKIREVITIAKNKMASKRFAPTLMGIPEEDTHHSLDPLHDFYSGFDTRRSSIVSLKRENSRKRTTCSNGCNEPVQSDNMDGLYGKLPSIVSIPTCKSCSISVTENKKNTIRKWLENVPVIKSPTSSVRSEDHKLINRFFSDNLRSSFDKMSLPERISSPYSERALSPDRNNFVLYRQFSFNDFNSVERKPKNKYIRGSNISQLTKNYKPGFASTSKSAIPKIPSPVVPQSMKGNDVKIVSHSLKPTTSSTKDREYTMCQTPKLPPPDMINEAMAVDNKPRDPAEKEVRVPTITKQKMTEVINEFALKRGLEPVKNELTITNGTIINLSNSNTSSPDLSERHMNEYETDSLERSNKQKGYHTPTDYADVSSSQASPSLSAALPLEEEMTMRNAVFNINTGDRTISKLPLDDEHEYEVIGKKKPSNRTESKMFKLPELLTKSNGYSLVSEVYVNNGYNFGSAPTSPSESDSSSINSRRAKIRYTEPEKPGHLTIEVEDCPDNYIRVDDSDQFEPDTLDRKPSKARIQRNNSSNETHSLDYIDSLERPGQILLRTTGSFKSENMNYFSDDYNRLNNNIRRNFGSLREIYEAKTKNYSRCRIDQLNGNDSPTYDSLSWKRGYIDDSEKGRILTLEERHSRRQRKSTPPNTTKPLRPAPPDVIPPIQLESSPIYQHPGPPRKVEQNDCFKPPLPPKNAVGRSTRKLETSSKYCQGLNEDEDTASPNSTISFGLQSSISRTSVGSNSSDYEMCLVVESNGEEEINLCRHKGSALIDNFVHNNERVTRGINNQFILQSTNEKIATTLNKRPLESVVPNLIEESDKSSFERNAGKQLVNHLRDVETTETIKKTWRKLVEMTNKPEDSGYLSTDSNDSPLKRILDKDEHNAGLESVSETDESLGDGHSESGAESIETHSVFFGSYQKRSFLTGSADSGVGGDWAKSTEKLVRTLTETENDENTKCVSFVTVLPLDNCKC